MLSLGVKRSGHIKTQKTRLKCRRFTTGLHDSTESLLAWVIAAGTEVIKKLMSFDKI